MGSVNSRWGVPFHKPQDGMSEPQDGTSAGVSSVDARRAARDCRVRRRVRVVSPHPPPFATRVCMLGGAQLAACCVLRGPGPSAHAWLVGGDGAERRSFPRLLCIT
eukprot:5579019-Prymnesium_polylepis.1